LIATSPIDSKEHRLLGDGTQGLNGDIFTGVRISLFASLVSPEITEKFPNLDRNQMDVVNTGSLAQRADTGGEVTLSVPGVVSELFQVSIADIIDKWPELTGNKATSARLTLGCGSIG